jgi:hypothetical protein
VDSSLASAPAEAPRRVPQGSPADERMRRLLRVDGDRRGSRADAERVFGTSIAISAVRCLLTYILLPVLRPVVDLTGGVGPVVGLVISVVSVVAIVASMRRFFRSWHKWRWHYAAIGGAILVLIVVQATADVVALTG